MPRSGADGQRQSCNCCGIITIGFSSASGMRSCRLSLWKISVILRYADNELLDELDADEMGEKLLSGTYFDCCGFSSPAGLSRRSISLALPAV